MRPLCLLLCAALVGSPAALADIYEWEYVDPSDPSQGKQESTTLVPDGAGVNFETSTTLTGVDLTKAFLPGVDIYRLTMLNAVLDDACFVGARLENAVLFPGVSLQRVDFTDAVLRDWIVVSEGNFSDSVFERADLSNASFTESVFSRANLRDASLTATNFVFSDLTGADLSNARIDGASFGGSNSPGLTSQQLYSTASYQDRSLGAIFLGNNDLSGWDSSGQQMNGSGFKRVTLVGADFSDAEVVDARFSSADLTAEQLYSTSSYQQQELGAISFYDVNLTGFDFSSIAMDGSKLWSNQLSGAVFDGASLIGAAISPVGSAPVEVSQGVSFRGANLTGAHLEGVFQDAVLDGADISGATLISSGGAGFTLQNLVSTSNYGAGNLTGITLEGFDLTGGDFAGMDISQAVLAGLVMRGTSLDEANLTGSDMSRAQLNDATFFSAMLRGADFRSANLTDADLSSADLSDAGFRYANLANARIIGTGLETADFTYAWIQGATLGSTDAAITHQQLASTRSFADRDLSGVAIPGVDLRDYDLTRFKLAGADLTGVQFDGADLRYAELSNDEWGESTLSPDALRYAIRPDGVLQTFSVQEGQTFTIRGGPWPLPDRDVDPIGVRVGEAEFNAGGALRLVISHRWPAPVTFDDSPDGLMLAGALHLEFSPGLDGRSWVGRSIDLFDWPTSPSGSFDIMTGAGQVWDLSRLYTTGEATLVSLDGRTLTLAGDFNLDGQVDAADYTVWRDNVGRPVGTLLNDTATEGLIGDHQYTLWAANYGSVLAAAQTAPEPAAQTAPEPAAALLLLAAVGGVPRRWPR